MKKKCIIKKFNFPSFETVGYLKDCIGVKDSFLIKGVFDDKSKAKVFPSIKDAEFIRRNLCNHNNTTIEEI